MMNKIITSSFSLRMTRRIFSVLHSNPLVICLLGVVLLPNFINAQSDYMRKDTLYVQGKIFSQRLYKNNRTLVFTEKSQSITYTPEQVQEYGLLNGDSYFTRKVPGDEKLYFLHRLVDGKRTLYELKEKNGLRFFIEHDSTLTEIKKGQLNSQLSRELWPCGASQSIASLARFGRVSLRRAVWLSNRCFTGLFPRFRKGIFVGYESGIQSLESPSHDVVFTASNVSPVVGAFIDFPLHLAPSMFITVQATYQQNNYGGFLTDHNLSYDYQYNISTVGFPVLVKYRGSAPHFRPFLGLGVTPAIYWQKENTLWIATTQAAYVRLNATTLDNQKKFLASGTLSGGLEYSLSPRHAISLEVRYKKLVGELGHSFAFIGSYYF